MGHQQYEAVSPSAPSFTKEEESRQEGKDAIPDHPPPEYLQTLPAYSNYTPSVESIDAEKSAAVKPPRSRKRLCYWLIGGTALIVIAVAVVVGVTVAQSNKAHKPPQINPPKINPPNTPSS